MIDTALTEKAIGLLTGNNWEDISPVIFSVDQWIEIAKVLRFDRSGRFRPVQLVARIQCLLVHNRLIDDETYVERVQE